jgi:hypothetical protein
MLHLPEPEGGSVGRWSTLAAMGQTHKLWRCKRRTSEQREHADGKWADSQAMEVQRRTSEHREQANGKGADSHPEPAQRRTSEQRAG